MASLREQAGGNQPPPLVRPRRPEEIVWFVQGKMRNAVAAQQQDDQHFVQTPFQTARDLFQSFRHAYESPFARVRGQAINVLLANTGEGKYDEATAETMKRLMPSLFQYAAEHYLRAKTLEVKQKDASVGRLLSYERTLDVYQALYRTSRRIPHEFGLDGLEGVSLPDAIEVDETAYPVITRAYEITSCLSPNIDHFLKAATGFQMDLRSHGRFFGKYADLIYVVPKGIKAALTRELEAQNIKIPSYVQIEELPFTHNQLFGEFKQVLFNGSDAEDPNVAMLPDVQQEAAIQHNRLAAEKSESTRRDVALAHELIDAQRHPEEETSFYPPYRPSQDFGVLLSEQAPEDLGGLLA